MTQPIDHEIRRRAVQEVDRCFALSAGAGAGKTSVLVDRLTHHLLAGVPADRIAAITFTRAAANELLSRSRDAIEERLKEATQAGHSEDIARLVQILACFGQLTLSTIHSFCQELLRQEALEARWAPDTEVADIHGAAVLEATYEAWRQGFDARHLELVMLVRSWTSETSYMGSPSVRMLADTLVENRDLESIVAESEVLDWEEGHGALLALHTALLPMPGHCKNPSTCKLIAKTTPCLERLGRLIATLTEPRALVMAAMELEVPKVGRVGNSKDWSPADKKTFQGAMADLLAWKTQWRARLGAQLHRALVLDMKAHYLPAIEQARLDRAQADYADLLFRSRQLLRQRPEARRRLARRYQVVLIDEVQDTDPIQAEVAALLTASAEVSEPWHTMSPRSGSLFAVGDPKQSIYRFRRADVNVWQKLQQMVGASGESLHLRQNFRSVPGLVAWANHTFSELPDFVPQAPHRAPAELDPVVALGAESVDGEIEALIRHLVSLKARSARVFDKDLGQLREVRDSDFLILLPSWTKALDIQEKMLLAGIECTVEGGYGFFDRDEIRLSMAAMRAIEEPSDSEATVCILRGLFGVSFPELAEHRLAGGSWSYFHPSPPPGPVADALRELGRLHNERHRQSWVDLLDALLDHTGAPAVWALTKRRWNILANLDKLRALIRQLEPRTRTSSEVIEALRRMEDSGTEDQSVVDEDTGAARIMTYFKAKGLEAPVVAVVCASRNSRGYNRIIRRAEDRETLAARASSAVAPPDWSVYEAEEKHEDAQERRRWMYVAATRARDQLVLTHSPRGAKLYKPDVVRGLGHWRQEDHDTLKEIAPEVHVRGLMGELLPEVAYDESTFLEHDDRVDALLTEDARPGDPVGERRHQRMLEALAASRRASTRWRSVGNLTHRRLVEFEGGGVGPRGGEVVHQVMEHLDLGQPTEVLRARVPALTGAFGTLAGIGDELRDRCQGVVCRLLELPVIEEARRASERWREVPFAYPERGLIVAGKIDLCFPTNQKRTRWKVVDWKSHLPPTGSELHERYRRQLAYYTQALLTTVTPCQHVDAVLAGPHHEIGEADWMAEILEVVHPYLTGLVSELIGQGLVPTVGYQLDTRQYVELELAWPDLQVGLGLDLSEREIQVAEGAGWRIVALETGSASWPALAEEGLFEALGLEREDGGEGI